MTDEKTCFVISPIGELESDTRKRSDQVLKHVIRPAVSECGYNAIRADEIDKPGIITSQVIQHVVNDSLVIADLTERNPNVFYELAIRHAIAKPFIQLMETGDQIPFDVAATRTIFVDHRDLDSVADAKVKIREQINELESDSSAIETPISVSLDLQFLRQSEKPEDRSLADLVAAVSDLRTDVVKVESKVDVLGNEALIEPLRRDLSRIRHELRSEGIGSPITSGRMARILPNLIEEIEESELSIMAVELLIVASFFRQAAPWIHELALEAYRAIRTRSNDRSALLKEVKLTIDHLSNSRWGREIIGRGPRSLENSMMTLDICRHLIRKAISKYS